MRLVEERLGLSERSTWQRGTAVNINIATNVCLKSAFTWVRPGVQNPFDNQSPKH